MLRCQGSNLRDWISRTNDFHAHMQSTVENAQFNFPEIFCVDDLGDDDDDDETMHQQLRNDDSCNAGKQNRAGRKEEKAVGVLLYCRSDRGSILAPLVAGIVKRAAIKYFDFEVELQRLHTQGELESDFTVWRITEKIPEGGKRTKWESNLSTMKKLLGVSSASIGRS